MMMPEKFQDEYFAAHSISSGYPALYRIEPREGGATEHVIVTTNPQYLRDLSEWLLKAAQWMERNA